MRQDAHVDCAAHGSVIQAIPFSIRHSEVVLW